MVVPGVTVSVPDGVSPTIVVDGKTKEVKNGTTIPKDGAVITLDCADAEGNPIVVTQGAKQTSAPGVCPAQWTVEGGQEVLIEVGWEVKFAVDEVTVSDEAFNVLQPNERKKKNERLKLVPDAKGNLLYVTGATLDKSTIDPTTGVPFTR